MNLKDFKCTLIQASVFRIDYTEFPHGEILRHLVVNLNDQYPGAPRTESLPPDVAPEIPRIQIPSADGKMLIQASPKRYDSLYVGVIDTPDEVSTTVDQVLEALNIAMQGPDSEFSRLALIIHRVIPEEEPAEFLKTRFCNRESIEKPLSRSENFELHNHKRYTPDAVGTLVNSWVRCKSGRIIETDEKVAIIEQDLNTLKEDVDKRYSSRDAIGLLKILFQESCDILLEYFEW